jgi:hypothetical protein
MARPSRVRPGAKPTGEIAFYDKDQMEGRRMRKLKTLLKLSAVATLGWLSCDPALAASNCTALQGKTIGGALISAATDVTDGSIEVTDLSPMSLMTGRKIGGKITLSGLPAMCRVVGSVRDKPGSDVEFELWLPASGWNKRLLMWGNGGPAGNISYGEAGSSMHSAVNGGYATVSTNTGHWRDPKDAMMEFPKDMTDEAYIDFGHRAVHVTAVAAKAITRSYYSAAPQYSYFSGCSTGGRQAMMAARRYPDDFNGILSGAGVYNYSVLAPGGMWAASIKTSAGLGADATRVIKQAIQTECNATSDGFVARPDLCRIDPAKLVCKPGTAAADCLTPAQAVAVQKLIDGPTDAVGRPLGYGTPAVLLDFTPLFFPVASNPDFEAAQRTLDRAMTKSGEPLTKWMDGKGTDIAPYFAHGGKMIVYHGWTDALVYPANSIVAYEGIRDRIGATEADNQLRLFMVPGMGHCGGGNGGNTFGQRDVPEAGKTDPTMHILLALQNWVEGGKAPDHLVATKYEGDNPAKPVVRRTLLCPYPKIAKYNGAGNVEDAANYTCASSS